MTLTQPSPPPIPSPRDVARLRAENEALALQTANQALREGVSDARAVRAREAASGAAAGQAAPMGVVRGQDGRIVVTGRDGRQIVIDPRAVGDEDAVREMVQTALAPPRVPEPASRGPSGGDVAIVSIIFPCLIIIMLIVWRIVATSRRPGAAAAAGVPAELAGRLARIEQAIEAVAIEVERISESERYSARLLTERLPEARPGPAARLEAPTANVPR